MAVGLDRTETFIYSLVCLGAGGTEASSLHGSQEAKKIKMIWAWGLMPVIPILGKIRQEDCHKFKASLG